MFEFVGILKQKIDERSGEGRNGTWRVATYLLETVEMYPRKIVVDVTAGQLDRISEFDALIGKPVKIYFDIDAHEYNGRWYNSVRAFKAQAQEEQEQAEKKESKPKATEQKPPTLPPTAATINPNQPLPEQLDEVPMEDLPF